MHEESTKWDDVQSRLSDASPCRLDLRLEPFQLKCVSKLVILFKLVKWGHKESLLCKLVGMKGTE